MDLAPERHDRLRRAGPFARRADGRRGEGLDEQGVRLGVPISRRDRDRSRLLHDRDGLGMLAAVVAVVAERAEQLGPGPEVALTLDELLRLAVPAMEVLAPDRGEHVREVLGGDHSAPTITRLHEEPVGVAQVLQPLRVVGPGRDLREPVGRPGLTRHVAGRLEGGEGPLQQLAGLGFVTHVGLDPPERHERTGTEMLVVEPVGQLAGMCRRVLRLVVATQLDQALGASDGVASTQLRVDLVGSGGIHLDRPRVQRLGREGLVLQRLVRPPPEIERRRPGKTLGTFAAVFVRERRQASE